MLFRCLYRYPFSKILLILRPSIYCVLHTTGLPIASSIWLNTSKIALSIPAVTFALICIDFAKVMIVYMHLPNSILKKPLLKLKMRLLGKRVASIKLDWNAICLFCQKVNCKHMFQSSPCACSGMQYKGRGRGLLTLVYNIFHKDLKERKQKHLKPLCRI